MQNLPVPVCLTADSEHFQTFKRQKARERQIERERTFQDFLNLLYLFFFLKNHFQKRLCALVSHSLLFRLLRLLLHAYVSGRGCWSGWCWAGGGGAAEWTKWKYSMVSSPGDASKKEFVGRSSRWPAGPWCGPSAQVALCPSGKSDMSSQNMTALLLFIRCCMMGMASFVLRGNYKLPNIATNIVTG